MTTLTIKDIFKNKIPTENSIYELLKTGNYVVSSTFIDDFEVFFVRERIFSIESYFSKSKNITISDEWLDYQKEILKGLKLYILKHDVTSTNVLKLINCYLGE